MEKVRFRIDTKCDSLLNNISKAFNSVIIEARDKPIVTMLEETIIYMMEIWASNRMRFGNYIDDAIFPNITESYYIH